LGLKLLETVKRPAHPSPRRIAATFAILLLLTVVVSQTAPSPTKPHPAAVPNTHAPGEVDRPELVPYIVADPAKLPGIVVDETAATLVGQWQYSTHTPPYVGLGYLHDQNAGKGAKSVTFTPDLPRAGRYEVRLAHCYKRAHHPPPRGRRDEAAHQPTGGAGARTVMADAGNLPLCRRHERLGAPLERRHGGQVCHRGRGAVPAGAVVQPKCGDREWRRSGLKARHVTVRGEAPGWAKEFGQAL
jgi:hypothetical protein